MSIFLNFGLLHNIEHVQVQAKMWSEGATDIDKCSQAAPEDHWWLSEKRWRLSDKRGEGPEETEVSWEQPKRG